MAKERQNIWVASKTTLTSFSGDVKIKQTVKESVPASCLIFSAS